jgi:hypothetical protein
MSYVLWPAGTTAGTESGEQLGNPRLIIPLGRSVQLRPGALRPFVQRRPGRSIPVTRAS